MGANAPLYGDGNEDGNGGCNMRVKLVYDNGKTTIYCANLMRAREIAKKDIGHVRIFDHASLTEYKVNKPGYISR